ncbi:hypothetical protein DBR40_09135 [Pedobacter sp. KBW01]|uniref:hypothetical protein n=1 Tax=Pedobacter sp. KBW01 TaxID=2153364 RepID=UPI000F598FF9|nr:hypothetical protein [Pedobacter sp. KBW01]RQO78103.1 hypothetical protein DBR40_09135 [Pedobacter sp. KBW01]
MQFITPQEFTTHIFEEAIGTISQGNQSNFDEAIETAMSKAARCLGKYNTDEIFASQGADKKKYSELITYIKDIAKYHFISVSPVQVDFEAAERKFKAATQELEKIQHSPLIKGWPLAERKTSISYGSNPKFFTERW